MNAFAIRLDGRSVIFGTQTVEGDPTHWGVVLCLHTCAWQVHAPSSKYIIKPNFDQLFKVLIFSQYINSICLYPNGGRWGMLGWKIKFETQELHDESVSQERKTNICMHISFIIFIKNMIFLRRCIIFKSLKENY